MTSVVDTSVKHFHSGMTGAPVLNGVAGSMIALLNACLITGFDTKSATSLVVVGGVATLSFAGTHSATVDSVVLVAASSVDALNGEQKVTAIGSGFVKFATAAADGTAAGTITFKMAPAGWAQPFVGTNLATYKSADPAGTGMILRVDDTGTLTCRVVGYEQMTDINTGSGAFPTAVQMSGGGYWSKSSVANATGNNWYVFTDGRTLICHVAPNSGATVAYIQGFTHGFGDAIASRPGGDPYACFLSYSINSLPYNGGDGALDTGGNALQRAFPRLYTGLGTCALHGCWSCIAGSINTISGVDSFFGNFPSAIDGGLRLSRRFFASLSGGNPRADVPGLYFVPMGTAFDSFKVKDIISGTGALAGRKLFALNPANASNSIPVSTSVGVSFIDITGPWR